MNKKILDFKDAPRLRDVSRQKVLVGGCFDIIHIGHIRFLQSAKKEGDVLIVALESDEFIEKYKKRDPFHTQTERAEMLAAFEMVDYILLLPLLSSYRDYFNLVKEVSPKYIAVTQADTQLENKKKQAHEVGAIIREVMPFLENKSTTRILQTMYKNHSKKEE